MKHYKYSVIHFSISYSHSYYLYLYFHKCNPFLHIKIKNSKKNEISFTRYGFAQSDTFFVFLLKIEKI